MADNKKSAKVSPASLIAYAVSGVMLIVSFLIYHFIPESEIANSIEHSSMTAVYLMVLAPVLCLSGLLIITLGFKKQKANLLSVYKNTLVYSYFGINALVCVVCAILEILFISTLFTLGFASPSDGTVYETYGIIVLVCGILQVVSSVLLSAKFKSDVKK